MGTTQGSKRHPIRKSPCPPLLIDTTQHTSWPSHYTFARDRTTHFTPSGRCWHVRGRLPSYCWELSCLHLSVWVVWHVPDKRRDPFNQSQKQPVHKKDAIVHFKYLFVFRKNIIVNAAERCNCGLVDLWRDSMVFLRKSWCEAYSPSKVLSCIIVNFNN